MKLTGVPEEGTLKGRNLELVGCYGEKATAWKCPPPSLPKGRITLLSFPTWLGGWQWEKSTKWTSLRDVAPLAWRICPFSTRQHEKGAVAQITNHYLRLRTETGTTFKKSVSPKLSLAGKSSQSNYIVEITGQYTEWYEWERLHRMALVCWWNYAPAHPHPVVRTNQRRYSSVNIRRKRCKTQHKKEKKNIVSRCSFSNFQPLGLYSKSNIPKSA